MVSKYNYKVGDKLKSKCGYELKVVEIYSPSAIRVEDELGRSKVLSSSSLFNGKFKWTYADGSFCDNLGSRKPRIRVGDEFESNHYGKFKVVSQEGKHFTVVFLKTGYIKNSCNSNNILIGNICDNSTDRYHKIHEEFKVGTRFLSKRYGYIEVVQYVSSCEIKCRWINSGHTQSFSSVQLRKPQNLVDKSLDKHKNKHYVYIVKLKGEVIYIGKGKHDRYLHPNSGTSHNREMNRLHFQGAVFDVEFAKENLTNEEAEKLELELIGQYDNLWNVLGNRNF